MKVQFWVFIIVLRLIKGYTFTEVDDGLEEWIESPKVTNWGEWGDDAVCNSGQFAIGFQLKSESNQGNKDDTALNAIRLLCGSRGSRTTNKTITSLEGQWGGWGDTFYCEGLMNGFQLRSEGSQNSGDDTAANNFRAFCVKDSGLERYEKEGDGQRWGSWSQEQYCSSGRAVCGIQTQVEKPLGKGLKRGNDDTGLNNVRLKCCEVANEGDDCTPSDEWKEVTSCDNRNSPSTTTCTYSKTVGTTSSKTDSHGGSSTSTSSIELGWGYEAEVVGLKANFEAKVGKSSTTGTDWHTIESKTWTEEETVTTSLSVPGGKWLVLKQVIGKCGSFTVRTAKFKVDTVS